MAKPKIDAKEFMLQYGDRIGIGLAGFLALLLIVFACLGGGGDVSADDINKSRKDAKNKMDASVPDPVQIALTNEQVKTLAQIDDLAKSLTRYIAIDVLQLNYPFYEPEPLRGKFRFNPRVLEPTDLFAVALDGAWRRYETNGNSVMVVSPGKNIKVKLPKSDFKKSEVGAAPKGQAPPPPGTGGTPGGGLGSKSGPGAGYGKTGPTQTSPVITTVGAEEGLTVEWKADDQITANDSLGITIMPVHTAYLVATFPHGKQADEITKALQLGNKSEAPSYYQGLEVQRRRILPKGGRLPDGKLAEVDMVFVKNPANLAEDILKPMSELDNMARTPDVSYDEKAMDRAAGWEDVNIVNVAKEIRQAYKVAVSNNEGFYAEKNSVVQQLLDYAGPKVALRLPNLIHGEYPEVYKQLKDFMMAVNQIEKDAKASIPKPPIDPRMSKEGFKPDDPFNTEETGPGQKESKQPEVKGETGPVPDQILLRFVDLDLRLDELQQRYPNEAAVTVQYRMRIVLNNPNYKDEKNVADPVFAKKQYLTSDHWSPVQRITFQPDALSYSDERVRKPGSTSDEQKDKAPIQLHKWLGMVETVDKQTVPVGAWWIERFLVARGEYIGKYPELPGQAGITNLVQWISSAFDTVKQVVGGDVQKPTRTYELETKSLLVDFTGGYFWRFRSSLGNKSVNEDLPCETLILEPDGRLVCRYSSDDKNDEVRKARFTQWDEWVKKLPKNEKKATGGQQGGGGAPGTGS